MDQSNQAQAIRSTPASARAAATKRYRPVVEALENPFADRLKTVVLFGSQVRGKTRDSSDHDLFVVVADLPLDPLARLRTMRSTLLSILDDLPGAIGFIAKTPEEVAANLTPLLLDVCVEGICLCGADYFEPYRRRALAALRQSGLRRKRVGNTRMWLFPELPTDDWALLGKDTVKANRDVAYRLGLAEGFVAKAAQDMELERWRSCVDNAQLAVENAGKAVLALFGVAPKTHDPAQQVAAVLRTQALPDEIQEVMRRMLPDLLALGSAEYFLTDYGDEATYTLPWDLFTRESAEEALTAARRSIASARQVILAVEDWRRGQTGG